jgi:hypothetical protein
MEKLKSALENLDAALDRLEDKIGLNTKSQTDQHDLLRKQTELLKVSRSREASVLAVAQKVAARLDQTISRVEQVLRD